MKYFSLLLFLFFFFSGFSSNLVYDFRVHDTIPQAFTMKKSSDVLAFHGDAWNQDGYEIVLDVTSAQMGNTWYIGIDRRHSFHYSDEVCVEWNVAEIMERSCLDIEDQDMKGEEPYSFTMPIMTPMTSSITLKIRTNRELSRSDIRIFSLSTQPVGKKLAWKMPLLQANDPIVKRSEWGADETLRYADNPLWKTKYASYIQYIQNPKTQEQLDAIILGKKRESYLAQKNPLAHTYQSVIRFENGHKLVWPIQKTKQVDRIIVHHTAESLDKNLADEDFIRAIYAYHTLSRQWGDIGYNYIIGQRGKIYEGRAGGDYVVGAHASYNNAGTVGISVIGNFESLHLNRDQKNGLEAAIDFFAQKYGITLEAEQEGVRICKTPECSLFDVKKTKGLLGHRDVGYTTCPGQNIYDILPEMTQKYAKVYAPVFNTEASRIDPLPQEEIMNMERIGMIQESLGSGSAVILSTNNSSVSSGNISNTVLSTPMRPSASLGGPGVKIRLSYSGTSIDIQSATQKKLNIKNGLKRIIVKNTKIISVGKVGNNNLYFMADGKLFTGTVFSFSSDVVRIPSWSRVPAWDTNGKYNDNMFRGKIIVRNDNGKLLIINELPLEDYLRGMGEVSNTDPVEKIKTIVVAARSYMKYYISKENRKFHTSLYDGSDNPDEFQKYLGYGYELRSPNVSTQVQSTKGEIITYQGKLIKPWYFNESDGKTRSYREYCESNGGKNCMNIPYLQSIDDPASVGHTRKGHGVGISGIGATYAANLGKTYKEIIAYYLTGVAIEKK